ncbi:hypothetical protein AB0J28_12070 [Streptosporangium canum]|uniref:hypothetical protein n=1 Tax=Streptosporangium canum TaxID=324952 RepID=UPI00341B677B
MGNTEIHFDALDDCAGAAKKASVDFGALAETYPAQFTFRSQPSSSALTAAINTLAEKVGEVEKSVDSEMGWAMNRLGGVALSLPTVGERIRGVKYPDVNG